jgi:hypothetical protein
MGIYTSCFSSSKIVGARPNLRDRYAALMHSLNRLARGSQEGLEWKHAELTNPWLADLQRCPGLKRREQRVAKLARLIAWRSGEWDWAEPMKRDSASSVASKTETECAKGRQFYKQIDAAFTPPLSFTEHVASWPSALGR